MAEITEVLEKLVQRTKEGKVPWKLTSVEQTFVAVVGNNSTMISIDERPYPVLKILDSAGVEIEMLDGKMSSNRVWRPALTELHQQARRTARAVGETLNELLEELEKVE